MGVTWSFLEKLIRSGTIIITFRLFNLLIGKIGTLIQSLIASCTLTVLKSWSVLLQFLALAISKCCNILSPPFSLLPATLFYYHSDVLATCQLDHRTLYLSDTLLPPVVMF